MAQPGSPAPVPARIGRFEIVRLLQESGMGRLYVARHPTLQRDVVLKTLSTRARRHSTTAIARLKREAEILAKLAHDGICPVLDFIEEEDEQYVVMPLIEGEDLGVRITRAARKHAEGTPRLEAWREIVGAGDALPKIVELIEELARAVHAAHDKAVIHRDLKPSNVIVRQDGRPVVLDFGVALDRADAQAPPLTDTHATPGTIFYMSPEQLRGEREKIDRPSDVYALGAILYEVLSLRRAIGATDTSAAVAQILGGHIDPLRRGAPEIPRDLEAVCVKALEREPRRRYATALEFAEDLRRFRERRPTVARPLTPVTRAVRFARRNPALAAAGAALLVVVVAAALTLDRFAGEGKRALSDVDFVLEIRKQVESGASLPPADQQRFEGIVPEENVRRSFLAAPLTPEAFSKLVAMVSENYRSASEHSSFTAIAPVGGVVGAPSRFRFRVHDLPEQELDLVVELASTTGDTQEIARLTVTAKSAAGGEVHEVALPATVVLEENEAFEWIVRPAPEEDVAKWDARFVRFKVVDPARLERSLAAVAKTESAELNALLRASACLGLGLGQAALDELVRLPAAIDPKLERTRAILAAQAHAILGHRDEVDRIEKQLFDGALKQAFAAEKQSSASGPVRSRVALLVGIDEYAPDAKGKRPPSLAGAVGDVRRVRELLVRRFQFAPDNVKTLENEQATHAAIVGAFHDWLIAQSGPDSEALFWFSGHGSLCEDLSGEHREERDKDSTFLAYDSRVQPGRTFDITDDEVHSLVRALCERKSRVTVVTDSCHSGGATRGPGVLQVRFAEESGRPPRPEDLAPFWPKDVRLLEDDEREKLEELRYVHLAACAEDESAHEHAIDLAGGGRQVHGAFTFFLLDALERASPDTTYRRLENDLRARVTASYRGQEPRAEGSGNELNRVVFGGAYAAPLPGFEASVGPKRLTVDVAAGWIRGLREGSVLEIQDLGGNRLGRAVVRVSRPSNSRAEWIGDPPVIAAAAGARAIEVATAPDPIPLRVFVAPDPALDALAAELAACERPRLDVVRDPTLAAPVEVARSASGVGKSAMGAGLELRARPEGFFIRSIAEGGESAALAKEAQFHGLFDLSARTGTIGLMLSLETADPGSTTADEPAAQVTRRGDGSASGRWRVVVPAGTKVARIGFRLRLDPARKSPAWVSVLALSEDRTVDLLFPKQQVRGQRIDPGKDVTGVIRVFETEIKGLGRPGRDRIVAIATERPAEFSDFIHKPEMKVIGQTDQTRGGGNGTEESLPDVLLDALSPCLTRGTAPVETASRDERYGVAALDMEVESAD